MHEGSCCVEAHKSWKTFTYAPVIDNPCSKEEQEDVEAEEVVVVEEDEEEKEEQEKE